MENCLIKCWTTILGFDHNISIALPMSRPFGAVSGIWRQNDSVRVRESWDGEGYLNRKKEFSYTTVGFPFSSLLVHK